MVLNGIEAMDAVEEWVRELLIRAQRNDSGGAQIEVHDRGVGIDPKDAERIFDVFYTTKPDGMGMGLRISRSIVEAHGGRIWATANNGRGARVQFLLPSGTDNGA